MLALRWIASMTSRCPVDAVRSQRALAVVFSALLWTAAVGGALAAEPQGAEVESRRPRARQPGLTAVEIEADAVAEGQVLALGRDLVVRGQARSGVAAIGGSAYLSGDVRGDVIVLGGDAVLESGARVTGDVLVLGGTIQTATGASISGRSVAYPAASSAWLVLAEGPALGVPAWSPLVLGAKLALTAAWMVVAMVLLATAAPAVRSTAERVAREPLRNFAIGLVAVLTMLLGTLFLSTFVHVLIGAPLLVLVVLVALLLKLWGLVAVFCWFGSLLQRGFRTTSSTTLERVVLGLLVLGAIKLLPWVGTWAWTAATLIGVGASISSKFGSQEDWLEA